MARENPVTEQEVTGFVHLFFQHYFLERNPGKVLNMVADQALCIGLGSTELGTDKQAFGDFLCEQMLDVTRPLPYRVLEYVQYPAGEGAWVCFALVEVRVNISGRGKVLYHLRMTFTIHSSPEGLRFSQIHVSESRETQENLGQVSWDAEGSDRLRQELNRLLSQLIPGGVLCCYAENDYPLVLANDAMLKIGGYSSYRQFYKVCDGKYLNAVHPEDRARYAYNLGFASRTGQQVESEYRLRRRDGGYVWIHDVMGKSLSEDGRPLLIGALFDVSDQVQRWKKLEIENGVDALTGASNRKGGRKQILESAESLSSWCFFVADLDNFKRVNDFYGHKQGDQVLCIVVDLLRKQFGSNAIVIRLGGDEFGLFLKNPGDTEKILRQADQVVTEYRELLERICPKSHSTLSMGGIFGTVLEDLEQIYERADRNLYQVKHHGKNRVLLTPWNLNP